MLRFGPAGVPEAARNAEEGVRLVSEMGLQAMEVEFVRGVRMGAGEARRVGRAAAELGVRLSAHAPYFVNLNSKDAGIIERSRQHLLRTMGAARDLGAPIVVVHAGFYSGMAPDEATEVIARGVSEVREAADGEGCSGVVLGLETMGKKGSWGTFGEMRQVCSRVGNVQPVVDFSHIHARGRGSLRTREDFASVLAAFEAFDAPFLHGHFTGVEWGPSGERRHLEVSSASPDFSLLAPLLLEKEYDITLICESPAPDRDALLMQDTVEKSRPKARGAGRKA